MKRQTGFTVLILSFLVLAVAGRRDNTPWLRYNNAYYKFTKQKATWSEANAYCARRGANLALPRTASENFWLKALANYSGNTECWWIGAHDQLTDDIWTDTHNVRLTYTNWGKGEPNNVFNKESCAELCTHYKITSEFGYWNDLNCNTQRYFICQRFTNPGK